MTAPRRSKRPQRAAVRAFLNEFDPFQGKKPYDRLSDFAGIGRPGRHRGVGRIVMSAEIILFIRGPKRHRELSDFPTIRVSVGGKT